MLIQNVNSTPPPARVTADSYHGTATNVLSTATEIAATQAAAEPAKPAAQQPNPAQVKAALDNINKTLKQSSINLQFNVDTTTKRPVIKMIDGETGDVIRQFPTEDALAISRSIDKIQQGLLLKQKA